MTTEATEITVDQLAVMAERMARLEALVISQQAEIARLHAATAPLPAMPVTAASIEEVPTEEKPQGRASRRALLKLGGAAAAAGVAAAVAGTGTAQAHSATATFQQSASGGGNIAIEGDGTSGADGVHGSSDANYGVYGGSGSGVGVVGYTNTAANSGVLGTSTNAIGVWGNSTNNYAVYGTSSSNVAVYGNSSTYVGVQGQGNGSNGVGGWFTGGRAALALGAGSVPGAPTSGAHYAGDIYLDSALTIWVCTANGTPGWWTRLVRAPSGGNLLETASGTGHVAFEGQGTSGAGGMLGTSDTTTGVYGATTSGIGVQGFASGAGAGIGVRGSALGTGDGVNGSSNSGYGGGFSGGLAPVYLAPSTTVGAPSSGSHLKGELYVDANGALWSCTANGTPGTWIRLSGPQANVPGGALNYLAAPIRIFDSRWGQPAPLPSVKGALAGGNTYTIQVTGTTVGGLSVPTGATGVFGNLTVTNTQGGGDLILWPHGAPQPLTSNINYSGGMTIANAVNVGLSGGGAMDLYVHVSGTDVIFDVAGYVL